MDVIDALDDDSEGDVDNPTEIETRTRSNMVLQVENPTVQVGTAFDILEEQTVDTATQPQAEQGSTINYTPFNHNLPYQLYHIPCCPSWRMCVRRRVKSRQLGIRLIV